MPHDTYPARRPRPPRTTRPPARLGTIVAAVFAVGALVALFLSGIAAESLGHKQTTAAAGTVDGGPDDGDTPKRAAPSPTPSRLPGIGQPVRDGKFEFVVTRVDCSKNTVGLEHLNRKADGRYCVVDLSVRNIGDDAQYFLGRAQTAVDISGLEYTDDEFASLYANRLTQTFLRKINPGRRVTGKLVYDIPDDTTLSTMELHDSLLSGGVEVTLK